MEPEKKEQSLTKAVIAEKSLELRFVCPNCNSDITGHFTKRLSVTTGVKVEDLQNGELKFLPTFLSVGKYYLEVSGIKYDKDIITEKTSERVLQMARDVLQPQLQDRERQSYLKSIEQLKQRKFDLETRIREQENAYQKLESEFELLKSKAISNPVIKGNIEQSELIEDLEANFPDQQNFFQDVSKRGGCGDISWRVQINVGRWIDSGENVIIDSKDKSSVNDQDIDKLLRDMEFNKSRIGIIIAAKQNQLRLKECPVGVYRFDKGYLIITSREHFNHHIILKFVRDVLTRMFYESKNSEKQEKTIDTNKLTAILTDIMKVGESHKKIKSKAEGIIQEVDEGDAYLQEKLQEAWKVLTGV